MQPLTASEIDAIAAGGVGGPAMPYRGPAATVTTMRAICSETLDRLIATARLAPQWRPGGEPPLHINYCTVQFAATGNIGVGFWSPTMRQWRDPEGDPIAITQWTSLPEPPAAPGEGEKA